MQTALISLFILMVNFSPYFERLESKTGFYSFNVNFNLESEDSLFRLVCSENAPAFFYNSIEEKELEYDRKVSVAKDLVSILEPIYLYNKKFYPVIVRNTHLEDGALKRISKLHLQILTPQADLSDLPGFVREALKGIVLNYSAKEEKLPAGVIMVIPAEYYQAVLPLINWKERKGYKVYSIVVRPDTLSPSSLRNYLSYCWSTCDPRPEYVILVGGVDKIPTFNVPGETSVTDQFYGNVDNDFIPEMIVGRLDVENYSNLLVVVKKILKYETDPDLSDPTWFKRALMVGANYPEFMTTPIAVKKRIREDFLTNNYTEVDTVYYDGNQYNQTATDLRVSIDRGVSFLNYRSGLARPIGWYYPVFTSDSIYSLNNGWRLPVVTSIVCYTGAFNHPACFGRKWLIAGDTVNPKGGIAFYGASSPNTHTRWNNALDYGFYGGLLHEGINNLGALVFRSKMEVFLNFYEEGSYRDSIAFYFYTYNLLGDPTLEVWTDTPSNLLVNHPAYIPFGNSTFWVRVLSAPGTPLKGSVVCLMQKDRWKMVSETDEQGYAYFNIEVQSSDSLFLTVTYKNHKPYLWAAIPVSQDPLIGYYSHLVSDSSGYQDGFLNPGETVGLSLSIKNYGSSRSAENVTLYLSTQDPRVQILSSYYNYGSIAPGQVKTGGPFLVQVSPLAENERKIRFDAVCISTQDTFRFSFWSTVKAPEFQILSYTVSSPGGIINPGTTYDLSLSVKNAGSILGGNVRGVLRSFDGALLVLDSVGNFGNINPGGTSSNTEDPFRIHVSSQIHSGRRIPLTILFSAQEGFQQSVPFELAVGTDTNYVYLGPDAYGFYCYDNFRVHSHSPSYEWIEIDPQMGGGGTIILLGDEDTRVLPIPFNFKFYGENYSNLTICSNGYILMGSLRHSDMYNWVLPSLSAPPAIVAPFWDDLNPSYGGRVCYYYDQNNHRFIIEWSRVKHVHNFTNPSPGEEQTFQVILLDPTYYPTPSGDGEIIFQYKEITNDDVWHKYATIGIQDHTQSIGLLYTYNNTYHPSRAPVTNGRAIKFTTSPPDPLSGLAESGNVFQGVPWVKDGLMYLSLPQEYVNLSLYDVSGRVVRSIKMFSNEGKAIVDVSDLPRGVFFVEVICKERKEIKRVIKLD